MSVVLGRLGAHSGSQQRNPSSAVTNEKGDPMNDKERTPSILVYSTLLGIPFIGSWLGFTATVAEDGREPVTEWLDQMWQD